MPGMRTILYWALEVEKEEKGRPRKVRTAEAGVATSDKEDWWIDRQDKDKERDGWIARDTRRPGSSWTG